MNLKGLSDKFQKIVPHDFSESVKKMIKKNTVIKQLPSVRLACDLGKTKLSFLQMVKTGDEVLVTKFLKIPRPEEGGNVIDFLKQAGAEGGFQTSKIRIAVKGQGVIIRFIQFPQMNDEELRGAITFEAEKYIPFKSEEVIVDYHIIDREVQTNNGKMMNILLVAVKRDEIYPLIQVYQDAGFQVEMVDADVLSFLNAMEFLYPDDFKKNTGVLDFGSEVTTLGIVKDSKPQFIRDIAFGNKDLTKRLKRKTNTSLDDLLSQLSQTGENPSPELEQTLIESLQPLIADLKVSFDFYADQMQASEPIHKIYISGIIGSHPVVSKILSNAFGFEFAMIDVAPKIKLAETVKVEEIKQLSPILPVALGLCLRDA